MYPQKGKIRCPSGTVSAPGSTDVRVQGVWWLWVVLEKVSGEEDRLSSDCWCLAAGPQLGAPTPCLNQPHPVVGSRCLAAKDILTQGPGPAIGMRWIRSFQFPEAYVCPSPKPQPLEDVEKGEDRIISSLPTRTAYVFCFPAPQFRINCPETC